MNIAVIGCGYWGNHLLRNFHQSENWNLKYACDEDKGQLQKVSQKYPNVTVVSDFMSIDKNEIDAVCIATPVDTHYKIAKEFLSHSIHAWVEKPLTSSSEQAQELINIANSNEALLHVDHTYIYTPAVKKIKELIDKDELGEIKYFDSIRINLGLFQHDVNVVWDLAPHDFSLLQFLLNKKPVAVNATGKAIFKYGKDDKESISYITVHFEDDTIAHFNVNWLSPVKIRQIIIGGSKKMLVFNDMEQMEKIKVYDSGVKIEDREEVYETLIQYRTGDMYSPKLDNKEALREEVEHFYNAVKDGDKTTTDGESGLYVVKILEAANKSLRNNGEKINL